MSKCRVSDTGMSRQNEGSAVHRFALNRKEREEGRKNLPNKNGNVKLVAGRGRHRRNGSSNGYSAIRLHKS